ncbi:sensor histidine kinase [Actinoplanes bogorensis]|uniref:Sensor histidine kinase n=1 Tax=Paractinoplanes bogorensis TaxID=1610840 RepID=A0ABS5YV25_9ACTN|nr:sensor histidine kinase [Actinoplanes bogorensis]MBU2667302.1 sensor histidine kinase [Actinoplanes bogorensis]
MRFARFGATAAATASVVVVAVAWRKIARPSEETWFFAPEPFTGPAFVLACGVLALVWAITGAILAAVRPRNAIGWLVLGVGVSQALAVCITAYSGYGLLGSSPSWGAYFGPALYLPGWLIPPTLLLALYPDGRLPSAWWRWPVGSAMLSIVVLMLCIPFPVVDPIAAGGWGMVPRFPQRLADLLVPGPRVYDLGVFLSTDVDATIPALPPAWAQWSRISSWAFTPLLVLSMVVIWVGTVLRLVRAQFPRRQQLVLLICMVMPFLAASFFVTASFANVLMLLPLLLVPIAVAVGVLRYRLFGIETVLRRGLVYGMYTAVVVGAYLGVTAAVGTVVGATLTSRPLLGVIAAAAVAVALAPARDRLQHAADRLLYGQRRDPMQALTSLGESVSGTGPGDLLSAALTSVAAAVRAPGAGLIGPDGSRLGGVGADEPTQPTLRLPLRFGGTALGEVRVLPRRPGEVYTSADVRLLTVLALQVAMVVQAHRLTEQLEAERDRVVTAAEAERDRLRVDLHDGLGPSLSGIGLGLEALADTGHSPLLRRIQNEVAVALADVRRILDDLRPAALDTMTLPEAIRRHADAVSSKVPVAFDAATLPSLPADVENAAYRITTEALTNVARHADAREVTVSIAAPDGVLRIVVADDGHGTRSAVAGIGLTSMRRRAENLGGRLEIDSGSTGTTITATLPLEPS